MSISDLRIRQAKPADRPYKLTDSGGLFLEIRPNGSKLWRYQYRIAGKANLYAIGAYPEVTLQAARAEHLVARALVAKGVHPAHERARQKAAVVGQGKDTFDAIAAEWIVQKERGWSATYTKQVRDYLARDISHKFGRRPIRSITSADVLDLINGIVNRGSHTAAILVRQIVSQVFGYAIVSLRADTDPTYAIRGYVTRPPISHADAKSREVLLRLLGKVDAYGGDRTIQIAIRLLALTFVRTAEVRGARWQEFDWSRKLWTIPADRMKRRRQHMVPLSHQALSLLDELKELTGRAELLFPGLKNRNGPISNWTINSAIVRLGFAPGEFTGHDFRATASTHLHEMGYRDEIVDMQLAHASTNKVGAVYNHAKYLAERTQMMQAWADWIDGPLA